MNIRHVEISFWDGRLMVVRSWDPVPLDLGWIAGQSGYNLSAVCERLDVSERHLRRLFTERVGIPPKDWLKRQRMVVARHLLCERISVNEVAVRLGFAAGRVFARDFAACYGISPREFLRRQAQRAERFLQWRPQTGSRAIPIAFEC